MQGFECLEANFEKHVCDWDFTLLYLLCITLFENHGAAWGINIT